jgi:hypothetical protein
MIAQISGRQEFTLTDTQGQLEHLLQDHRHRQTRLLIQLLASSFLFIETFRTNPLAELGVFGFYGLIGAVIPYLLNLSAWLIWLDGTSRRRALLSQAETAETLRASLLKQRTLEQWLNWLTALTILSLGALLLATQGIRIAKEIFLN